MDVLLFVVHVEHYRKHQLQTMYLLCAQGDYLFHQKSSYLAYLFQITTHDIVLFVYNIGAQIIHMARKHSIGGQIIHMARKH
jgi:hypothetical protein